MVSTMSKGRLIIAFVLIVAAAFVLYAAIKKDSPNDAKVGINVIASIFPVYDFARAVGGDRVSLSMLLTPGLEAHSYEPRPSDISKLTKASLFVYTSREMEPWVADLLSGIKAGSFVKSLEAGSGVPVIISEAHEGEAVQVGGDSLDPHVWLDFTNAEYMVRKIAAILSEIDPEGSAYYLDNAEAYCLKLSHLDESFKTAIDRCSKKTIIHGGHYAFGYLAKRYGLQYMAAQGFSPDSELGPRQIAELMILMKESGSRYIFFEELVEPRTAETISKETGAGMLMLHAGHNISKSEFDSGVTFVDLMKTNLENLKVGLEFGGN